MKTGLIFRLDPRLNHETDCFQRRRVYKTLLLPIICLDQMFYKCRLILLLYSAGVGRTGTIITIDTMLKMAQAEGKVDIHNFICDMRKNRLFMVQTEV